jgi:hypothetical protein
MKGAIITRPVKQLMIRLWLSLHQIKKEGIKFSFKDGDWLALVSTEEAISERVTTQFQNTGDEPIPAVKEVTERVGHRLNSLQKPPGN